VTLSGLGQSLIRTRLGRLDVLGALHDGRGYEHLLATADTVDFDGRSLRVIDLQTLIEIKSGTGRAKDRLMASAGVPARPTEYLCSKTKFFSRLPGRFGAAIRHAR
jgi:hypothetical protein